MLGQPGEELPEVMPAGHDVIDKREPPPRVAGPDEVGHGEIDLLVDEIQRFDDLRPCDGGAAQRDDLIEHALGIAERAVPSPRNKVQCVFIDGQSLRGRDRAQIRRDLFGPDPPEIKPLAPGEDGGGNFVDFGCRKYEQHVGGRLFQRLEERVECLLGEHVDFVDDIHLVRAPGGGIPDRLPQVADLLNTAVGGTVDLQNVEASPLGDLPAAFTRVVGILVHRGTAVHCFREQSGRGGLPDAARPAEEIRVRDPLRRHGVPQGRGNMPLPRHVLKPHRPVFPRRDDVLAHILVVLSTLWTAVFPALRMPAARARTREGAPLRSCLPESASALL